MITADPQRRVTILSAINDILARDAAPDDRDLLRAFADVVLAEMPEAWRSGCRRPRWPRASESTSGSSRTRCRRRCSCTGACPVSTSPCATPTSRGPSPMGGHDGGPHEVTIVETHTPHAPFIFESLKNYFQKQGLRVFSAIHPLFTVRRQWERIVHDRRRRRRGRARAVLPVPHRAHRIAASGCGGSSTRSFACSRRVFLAVEDFAAMRPAVQRRSGARCASRARRPRRRRTARGLPRLALRRQLRAAGHACAYRARSRRRPQPRGRQRARRLHATRRCSRSCSRA